MTDPSVVADSAEFWFDARDTVTGLETTLSNRNGAGVMTLAAATNDPSVTAGSELVFDGDDYADIPYTPSYDMASGSLTVMWVGKVDPAMPSFDRLVSFESSLNNGLLMAINNSAKFYAATGDGTSNVNRNLGGGAAVSDNALRWFAAVIEEGTLRSHTTDDDANPVALASTPVFMAGRAFIKAYALADGGVGALQSLLIFESAISQSALHTVGDALVAGTI